MNEYQCACGQRIVRETILDMLDAITQHAKGCSEGAKELPPRDTQPKRRPYPDRALYQGMTPVRVMGYAGGGDFLVQNGESTTLIHRRHLTFTS